MKKSILNLGKNLNKTEQKLINGGDSRRDPDFCDEQIGMSREACLCFYFDICPNSN
ncbi:hypothetical protein [Tenacibaculum singaporense]|uniref:hypothetical protein n=1 Tax=Tenacibaculum singaporense TaxID=2358479 RepID=UPI00142E1331|nr:hypothetical protein [Tenacibaculum singaporense]